MYCTHLRKSENVVIKHYHHYHYQAPAIDNDDLVNHIAMIFCIRQLSMSTKCIRKLRTVIIPSGACKLVDCG